MNYTLHQLKIFSKICELKSITKASEAMHLTQPAVSIQLKKLQDQFEIPLTEVIGRQLYVTDFGERIAAVSNRILQEAELIKTTANQYKGLLTGKIRFSIVSTGKYVMPYFLTEFVKKYPEVDIVIDVTNKNLVVKSLTKNTTDFALVSVLPDLALETIPLMDNHLHLVAGKAYFEQTKNLSVEGLAELPLIFRERGSATRNAMENYLESNGISPQRTIGLVSNEAVKQAVNAGLGLSIMPMIGLRNELALGNLKILPMPGLPIITNWNLVYTQGKKLTPAASAFIEHIKIHKEEVIAQYFS